MPDKDPSLPPPSSVPVTPSTFTEVRATLETIAELDLRVVTIDEIKALLVPLWKGHIFVAPTIPSGLNLYRLRLFGEDKPENISEIGAPPPACIQENQRCNRRGESLFYCSTAVNAPFFELHVQVGQKLVLSTWKTTKQLLVNRVGYTRSVFQALRAARECPEWLADPKPEVMTEAGRVIDEFLAAKFTMDVQPGDEHIYKLTAAFGEKLLHGANFSFDGLLYPTVPMWGNADNLTLTCATVSSALRFSRAQYLQITKIEGTKITFEHLDTATDLSQDGAIVWKGHPDRWTIRPGDQVTLSDENGRWVARDASGEMVEPD